jgi:hypothetical protein
MLTPEQITTDLIGTPESHPLRHLMVEVVRKVVAEVRKEDETLIRQLADALDDCVEDSETVASDYVQAYGESFRPHRLKGLRDIVVKAREALAAASARLEKPPCAPKP